MVGTRSGTAASAVAAKIGTDHCEMASQQGRHGTPHQMRLRKPVQQEDSRSRSEAAQENTRFLRLQFNRFKIL